MHKSIFATAVSRGLGQLGLTVGVSLGLSGLALAQAQVAVLTHPAPASLEYVLHATMPIPAGVWDGNRSLSTLAIQNPDGSLATTQMEVVTRSATGVPEVVELIAKVNRPSEESVGDRLEYSVVTWTHGQTPHVLDDDVESLVDTPGALLLSTVDVFGNAY
ncbi:MAG TPA: hypothetical protein PLJ12_02820, partial [Planctomycetota bacterium]|nr:hypothetical protein [Planctomycetota bacterium]